MLKADLEKEYQALLHENAALRAKVEKLERENEFIGGVASELIANLSR